MPARWPCIIVAVEPVNERDSGRPVWQGEVHVFDLYDRFGPSRDSEIAKSFIVVHGMHSVLSKATFAQLNVLRHGPEWLPKKIIRIRRVPLNSSGGRTTKS